MRNTARVRNCGLNGCIIRGPAVGDFQSVAPLIRYLVLQLYKPDSLRVYVQALQGELPVGCLRRMDLLSQKRLPIIRNEASQPQPD